MSLFLIIRTGGRSGSPCMGLSARAGALMHTNAMRSVPPSPCSLTLKWCKGGDLWPVSLAPPIRPPPHLKDPVAHACASVLKRREESFRARRRYKVVGRRWRGGGEGDIFFWRRSFWSGGKMRLSSGSDPAACLASSWWLRRRRWAAFLGAQLACRVSADRMARFGSFAV